MASVMRTCPLVEKIGEAADNAKKTVHLQKNIRASPAEAMFPFILGGSSHLVSGL